MHFSEIFNHNLSIKAHPIHQWNIPCQLENMAADNTKDCYQNSNFC
jgi:hypothetical protein